MMEQSEILSVNRSKRFWTDARPLKRHYPDFDDDQAGEAYYRNQYRKIILPNIHNFTVKFTFITRHTKTVIPKKTEKIIKTTTIVSVNKTMLQTTTKKYQNITKKAEKKPKI
uniref:Bm11642 n=2 Tax=Brugia TaxID=6278 RepID=A0A0J9YEP5_BRUMA|nr:Bm11642 [Brugia malayi]